MLGYILAIALTVRFFPAMHHADHDDEDDDRG